MAQNEHYIDLAKPDNFASLERSQQVDHLMARQLGSWAAGGAFALATPEQVAAHKSRTPLVHEGMRRTLAEQLQTDENIRNGVLPAGYVRIEEPRTDAA